MLAPHARVIFAFFFALLLGGLGLSAQAQSATATTLAIGDATGPVQTVFTLTATVTRSNVPVEFGLVAFYDNDFPAFHGVPLATVVLHKTDGTATLKRAFVLGGHNITASFLGTATDAASDSLAVSLSVTGQYAGIVDLHLLGTGTDTKLLAKAYGLGFLPITGTMEFKDATAHTSLGVQTLNSGERLGDFAPQAPGLANITHDTVHHPTVTVPADFNGDGQVDVALIDTYTGAPAAIYLEIQSYGGAARSTVTVSGAAHLSAMAAADVNGDGKMDLIVAGTDTGNQGQVYVLLGQGDGTFLQEPVGTVGASPKAIAVADFNDDGKLDFALLDSGVPGQAGKI